MWNTTGEPAAPRWHSNDYLIRLQRGEDAGPAAIGSDDAGLSSQGLLAADPVRTEQLAVRRSTRISAGRVRGFATRNRSIWAIDSLVERVTNGLHDWASLRGAAIRFAASPRDFDRTLDRVKLRALWQLSEALHEREIDVEGERALLGFIATRFDASADQGEIPVELLLERLIHAGLGAQANALLPNLTAETWRAHAIAVDLEHPRFGGSEDALLQALNAWFHKFGAERVNLDGEGETAFQRLGAEASAPSRRGPLVTVIMTTHRPGLEALSAARSIVAQSHAHWELVVVDDGSPAEFVPLLERIAGLDPRIRVAREAEHVGTAARYNEALRHAQGEFVTFQHAQGWSHPRRLDAQIRDLESSDSRIANTIHAARVSDDLAVVGARGADLVLAEWSILFRREAVLDLVGGFDTVQKGAATEFRRRLEAASHTRAEAIAAEIPLAFQKADAPSDSSFDFETGAWIDPAWLAYRTSAERFHGLIHSGARPARLPLPDGERAIEAPSSWLLPTPGRRHVDQLIIADGRWTKERREFIDAVVDEIYAATAAGLSVGFLHSESLAGSDRSVPIAGGFQSLIDAGRLLRVFDEDDVDATVVVVRHAGAAQGHASERRPITATRAIVVDDPAAGDVRGETFSVTDVASAVEGWLDVVPEWSAALPLPQAPKLMAVVVQEGLVRVALNASDPRQITGVRIGGVELPVRVNGDGVVLAECPLQDLPTGELLISVTRGHGEQASVQGCRFGKKGVVTTPAERLLIPSGDRLVRVLGADESREFSKRYLSAEVAFARIFRDQLELLVVAAPGVELTGVYGLREVDGRIRRRDFALDTRDGELRGLRALDDIVGSRWKVFGTYETPFGPVEAPVTFSVDTMTQDSDDFRIRKLTDWGLGVIHVVPQERGDALEGEVPTLSVVMPVFNVAPYLDASIQSVLNQDFQDFELIIIDDASTDNSRKVIEMHKALDPRIRVVELDHNTLGGAGVPSNIGIHAARGKYIGFVDSDDWVTKRGFATMVDLAEEHDAQVVVGDFRTFDEQDRTVQDAYDSARWRDIPLGTPISASSVPDLLRLSPVPWRKLYRRDFMQEHHVLYPEGDYFYEDNPLHWHVLSRAERVVACDEVVSYHRMAREGQTMGANEYKLSAIASHANTILSTLKGSTAPHREVLFEQFIDYVSRQRWIVRRQTQPAAQSIIKHRLVDIFDRAVAAEPRTVVAPETSAHFAGYRGAYPDLDLTIVIPVFNSADLLRDTLKSVLKLEGLRYDVLLIDDGSTDDSLSIMREYEEQHENVHVFEQKNRGAGRARNSVIPLTTGRYTYFLDADDVIDARALREAVHQADADDADLLFVQYRIEYTDENRSRGMFNADTAIWRQLRDADDNATRQSLAAGLINYPWNRIIRTSLLHDANIFFGPTIVHNDVLFHWHSILAATRIGFLEVEVCTHRKFAEREQVTNINDGRRMAVLESLRGTHERISDLASFETVEEQWRTFALDLLEWAKGRIPAELQDTYERQAAQLRGALNERGGSRD